MSKKAELFTEVKERPDVFLFNLRWALSDLRHLFNMTPMQQEVFFNIASEPGQSAGEIAANLDASPGAITKVIAVLGEEGRTKEGLGLITHVGDPEDKRMSYFLLTPKGRRAIQSFLSQITNEKVTDYPVPMPKEILDQRLRARADRRREKRDVPEAARAETKRLMSKKIKGYFRAAKNQKPEPDEA